MIPKQLKDKKLDIPKKEIKGFSSKFIMPNFVSLSLENYHYDTSNAIKNNLFMGKNHRNVLR